MVSALIPVVVISLARSVERRAAIARHLASLGIPFTFFDAVDAQAMTTRDIANLRVRRSAYRGGMGFLPAELACLASFRAVLRKVARGNDDFVCILRTTPSCRRACSSF